MAYRGYREPQLKKQQGRGRRSDELYHDVSVLLLVSLMAGHAEAACAAKAGGDAGEKRDPDAESAC
jgi:hypothetical protein